MSNFQQPRKEPPEKSEFVKKFENRPEYDVMGGGGCDTCGYGAENGISREEFITVLNEMDAWIKKTFK